MRSRGTLAGRFYLRAKSVMPQRIRDALELFLTRDSILRTSGWLRSRSDGVPVDAKGDPLPWFTLAAIRFLEPRIRPEFRVFEYGAGNSTLWWADRASVASVEHNEAWFNRLNRPGIRLADGVAYVRAASEGGPYEIIVVDGILRPECAKAAIKSLSPSGVIVWDNTDEEVDPQLDGFKRLDFWGFGPLITVEWCTSIFYREDNCLGI